MSYCPEKRFVEKLGAEVKRVKWPWQAVCSLVESQKRGKEKKARNNHAFVTNALLAHQQNINTAMEYSK